MKHETFKSYVAVLIALVTVMGATAAGLASVAVSDANDADFAGLDASIRGQKADIVNHILAYERYRAYTAYIRYNELGNQLFGANQAGAASEAWGVARGLVSFLQPRYILADGSYNIERELQEAWAQDAQDEDLDALPYFEESDQLRRRSSILTMDMIVLAVAFWFLTVAQATQKNIKYLWAGIGVLLALAGTLGLLIGRFFV